MPDRRFTVGLHVKCYVQVSKKWYTLLKGCESYWKSQCEKRGIIGKTLKCERERVDSFKHLTISALKLEYHLSSKLKLNSLSVDGSFTSCVVPSVPTSNGYCYSQTNWSSSLTVIQFDNSIGSMVSSATVSNVFPGGILKVLWSFSSLKSAVLYTNSGRWFKFSFKDPNHPVVEEWQDIVYNIVGYRSTACYDCGLLLVMKRNTNEESLWDLEVIHLDHEKKVPTKTSVSFKFMPNPLYKQQPFFTVKKVELLHQAYSTDTSDSTDHFLLVQFGAAVARFMLTVKHGQCWVSRELDIFACSETSCIEFTSNQFVLSCDKSLLALVSHAPLQLCVWDLDNPLSEYKNSDMHDLSTLCEDDVNVQCLAVGHLFSILSFMSTTTHYLGVVATHTGNIIQRYCLLSLLPCMDMFIKLYSPSNEQWLNMLDSPTTCRHELCICVCTEKSNTISGSTFILLV